MSRLCRWSLLVGCVALAGLTAAPAWEALACGAPIASLVDAGCEARRPVAAAESRAEPTDLALAAAHD